MTNEKNKSHQKFKWAEIKSGLIILVVFYVIAIAFWLIFDVIFYLFNFMYIGTCIGLTSALWNALPKNKKNMARTLGQVFIGGYLFFGLGCGLVYIFFGYLSPENMQIEGFWFWLLAGYFAAGVMHYVIAKIIGPFLFNRGWCGWACWSAALFDLLPWKQGSGRVKKLGIIRYIHFFISMAIVFILVFLFNYTLKSTLGVVDLTGSTSIETNTYEAVWFIPEFLWFIIGNGFYYLIGVFLAFVLKDNRAFCKYICPITCFLKIGSKFALLKIAGDSERCTECGTCNKACPMDIKVSEYISKDLRVTSSECIFCMNCINACPNNVLEISKGIDKEYHEFLNYK
jgi:polyferredoxin